MFSLFSLCIFSLRHSFHGRYLFIDQESRSRKIPLSACTSAGKWALVCSRMAYLDAIVRRSSVSRCISPSFLRASILWRSFRFVSPCVNSARELWHFFSLSCFRARVDKLGRPWESPGYLTRRALPARPHLSPYRTNSSAYFVTLEIFVVAATVSGAVAPTLSPEKSIACESEGCKKYQSPLLE